MSGDRVEVDYDSVVVDGDEATLFDIGGRRLWLPKSAAQVDDDPANKVVWVEEWLAVKEELV